ncbi:hypothetical protein FB45DRAFT_869674 [Roridomyces roridus]|uniref:Uncharacterized protein n=1 Tax=Roridomyces roridus TaxID=1738132 RepID=A0AAD7BM02_9AGAR|nr:hypothetical protein FB45DRAFT_869674 [Roridomyces roridus]
MWRIILKRQFSSQSAALILVHLTTPFSWAVTVGSAKEKIWSNSEETILWRMQNELRYILKQQMNSKTEFRPRGEQKTGNFSIVPLHKVAWSTTPEKRVILVQGPCYANVLECRMLALLGNDQTEPQNIGANDTNYRHHQQRMTQTTTKFPQKPTGKRVITLTETTNPSLYRSNFSYDTPRGSRNRAKVA